MTDTPSQHPQRPAAPPPVGPALTPDGRNRPAPTVAPARRKRPVGRAVLLALPMVLVMLLAGLAITWWKVGKLGPMVLREMCTITTPNSEQKFDPEQTANAATIAAVGKRMEITERGIAIALATAMQESKIRNLDHGDRDSVGIFQQRPSQGWGTVEQIMNPVYASERFFKALAKVPNYSDQPMAEAAQAVQRSADGSFYAQHEGEALALAAALTGQHEQAITCLVKQQDLPVQQAGSNGLTPRANKVRTSMRDVFGALPMGGYEAKGVTAGHMDGSAHYEGRAIDVFFRPLSKANTQQGWEVAQWLVAHARDLHIATVIFDDHIWSAADSAAGWQPYTPPTTNADPAINNVLRHLDHVHVDVMKGA